MCEMMPREKQSQESPQDTGSSGSHDSPTTTDIVVESTSVSVTVIGRPAWTSAVTRGVCRLLRARGLSPLLEVPLPDGRRADVIATGDDGRLWLIEIKSSPQDYWADAKWPDYLGWCDRFLFAVPPGFPLELIPPEVGLIVADSFGAEILREDPRPPAATALTAARRKALLIRLARLAAERLQRLADPDFVDLA